MSESVTMLYEQAQVALAAYANVPEGTSFDRYVALLKLVGMGDAQARAFAKQFLAQDPPNPGMRRA